VAVSLFDAIQMDVLRRSLRIDPLAVRRLRLNLLKRFAADDVALASFPIAEQIELHPLTIIQRCDSTIDGATKLLLQTADGLPLETVILRPQTGRATVCVSSQVGCAAACAFCATGRMGIARNLSAAQILDQVVHAGQILATEGRQLRNVVFMGMGEPFHNEDAVYEALDRLIDREWFGLSPRKLCVSTVGIPDAMQRFAERFQTVRMVLSLHSARQDVREQLIPLAKKYSLEELKRTLIEVRPILYGEVMIEYLLLAGINDSLDDATALIDWLDGLDVHVNLIPYNAIDEAPQLTASDPATRQAFAETLKRAGIKTTTRYSLGNDIAAACGQLVQKNARQARSASDGF
jgi:23S rRNA (adenine2503-C2)-methyltransferase